MNKIKKQYLSILLLLFCGTISAQKNEIYSNNIASLQVVAGNDWLSPPVVKLNGDVINIAFDALTHEYHRYTYGIQHCEADWTLSDGIFTSDYIDGYAEDNVIENVGESQLTNVLYSHYSLQIPNENCRITMSGNYKLTVYDEDEDHQPVFTACFMVVEPIMNVALNVSPNTDIDTNLSHQQVGMTVNYGSITVTNNNNQIKTVVMQNGRWDNAVFNSRPQYVMPNGLRWEHNRDYIFAAGNEYRKFEVLDVTHTTMGLELMRWDGHNYNAFVWADKPRPSYLYDEDANGSFYIRNSNNIDNDYISDYVLVHFTLKSSQITDPIYVNGTWTNDQFTPEYKMEYDDADQCYKAVVRLKMGYYSYQYLILKPDGTTAFVPSEGSFYQTENKYQALIYYRAADDRTDRLVGYSQVQTKL